MRKEILFLLLCTQLVLGSPKDAPQLDLSSSSPAIEELQDAEEITLFAPAGTELTVRFHLKSELLEADILETKMRFKRDLYFYGSKESGQEPLFSFEGEVWRNWGELFSGSLGVGYRKPGEVLDVKLELNQKP